MQKFYATGTKQITSQVVDEKGKVSKTSRTISVVIDIDSQRYGVTRAYAQNQVDNIAKKEGITIDGYGVRIVQSTQSGGGTMTKYAKQRKLDRGQQSKRKKK